MIRVCELRFQKIPMLMCRFNTCSNLLTCLSFLLPVESYRTCRETLVLLTLIYQAVFKRRATQAPPLKARFDNLRRDSPPRRNTSAMATTAYKRQRGSKKERRVAETIFQVSRNHRRGQLAIPDSVPCRPITAPCSPMRESAISVRSTTRRHGVYSHNITNRSKKAIPHFATSNQGSSRNAR